MSISTVFTNNRSQAVRLPADVRLPEGVKKVEGRSLRTRTGPHHLADAKLGTSYSCAGRKCQSISWPSAIPGNRPNAKPSDFIAMLNFLLDTHIVIYVIKRRPVEVMEVFSQHSGRMAISAITLSELHHGAKKSAKVAQNLAVVEEFASLLEVLPYAAKASLHYGAVRSALEKARRPIGVNDLHIAAHARSKGLTLVTNNLAAFVRVPGLLVENRVESLK